MEENLYLFGFCINNLDPPSLPLFFWTPVRIFLKPNDRLTNVLKIFGFVILDFFLENVQAQAEKCFDFAPLPFFLKMSKLM